MHLSRCGEGKARWWAVGCPHNSPFHRGLGTLQGPLASLWVMLCHCVLLSGRLAEGLLGSALALESGWCLPYLRNFMPQKSTPGTVGWSSGTTTGLQLQTLLWSGLCLDGSSRSKSRLEPQTLGGAGLGLPQVSDSISGYKCPSCQCLLGLPGAARNWALGCQPLHTLPLWQSGCPLLAPLP